MTDYTEPTDLDVAQTIVGHTGREYGEATKAFLNRLGLTAADKTKGAEAMIVATTCLLATDERKARPEWFGKFFEKTLRFHQTHSGNEYNWAEDDKPAPTNRNVLMMIWFFGTLFVAGTIWVWLYFKFGTGAAAAGVLSWWLCFLHRAAGQALYGRTYAFRGPGR